MTTPIKNVSGHDREIDVTGQFVANGATVDIEDDDLAARLLDQDGVWAEPAPPGEKPKRGKDTDTVTEEV